MHIRKTEDREGGGKERLKKIHIKTYQTIENENQSDTLKNSKGKTTYHLAEIINK